jgi:allophanate hydrolase
VEVWSIPIANLGIFLRGIPAPLGLGKVELMDGTEVIGFICEPYVVAAAEDITQFCGWVDYIKSLPRK